jgi:hypothetical protein
MGCSCSKPTTTTSLVDTLVSENKRRTTLDPSNPLESHHFHKADRLGALVLPSQGMLVLPPDSRATGDVAFLSLTGKNLTTEAADIRLLSARKLIEHIDDGGRMERRQALEEAGTDIFLDTEELTLLLPEVETRDHNRCTFSGIVALSYAWVTPEDPDPDRAQLTALLPVLAWFMCERARRKSRPPRPAGRWLRPSRPSDRRPGAGARTPPAARAERAA